MSSKLDIMETKSTSPNPRLGLSFEEKSVWIQLVSITLSMLVYSVLAWRMIADGSTDVSAFGVAFTLAVLFLIVLNAAGHAAAAIVSRQDICDERDKMFELRAGNRASWVLSICIFAAISALTLELEPIWIAHLLLGSLFASEFVKNSLRLLYYRRGV